MPIRAAQANILKKTACYTLAVLFCCPAFFPPQDALAQAPNYVIQPDEYRDSYILTQLFYSAFSVNDLAPIQQIVSQGMLAYPDDFLRFMALTLKLLKTPDSRLFMLLSPIAPYLADSSRPTDLENAIRLTHILTGQSMPGGGAPAEPSLKNRIKFYEDTARVVRRAPENAGNKDGAEAPAQPPIPGQDNDPKGNPPAYVASRGESFVFSFHQNNGSGPYTELKWTRPGVLGQTLSSRALENAMPDGSIWGGVYTDISGRPESDLAFFIVRDGIITFSLPRNIGEGNFYADETARPHQTGDLDPALFVHRPDGAVPRPCEMRIIISPRDDAIPPELAVQLEQTNAGHEKSDFVCRPQCVLSYSWGEEGYYLSGKSCLQRGWGVWPYGNERLRREKAAPSGTPVNTRGRS